ncbi:MAG: hypothetical protein ACI8WT_003133 [Clostridium sp.]|jgi:hypothetical protein
MQSEDKTRPKLISDFFTLEIDYKNDYVEYINTTNHKSVTSLLNNTKKTINRKILSTYKYAETKKLSSLFISVESISNSSKELTEQFKRLFNSTSYRKIDKNSKCYIRFYQNNLFNCNLFVPSEHIYTVTKAVQNIFTSPNIVVSKLFVKT